jgi:hypothetical protein
MARNKPPVSGSPEPQQEEMTVVVFKFKGGAESMQKGFDAVNSAIAALGPAPGAHHQRTVVQRTPAQIAPPPPNGHVIDAEHEDVVDETEAEEVEQETAAPATNGRPKKPLAPKQSFMNDFNLAPAGAPSWKDFATQKNPATETDKFLVASLWTQTHGAADPFTGGHLFTCFRAMNWTTQVDMIQPLRQMKSKKSYYENPERGKWKLTVGVGVPAAEAVGK